MNDPNTPSKPPLPPAAAPVQPPSPPSAPSAPSARPPGAPFAPYRLPAVGPAPVPPEKRIPLRTILLGILSVVALLSVIAAVVFRPPPPKKAQKLGARLDLAAGEVTVEGTGAKAISGTPLAEDATIKTGKGARALVRTGDGAGIFLRGDTALALRQRGVSVDGEIWLEVPRVDGDALEVRAGNCTITATDAGVDVRHDGNDVVVYVSRGLAVLTAPGGRVEINAGEQGVVKSDAKPNVSPVAFWEDWTGGMGDQRGARLAGSGTGRLYGLDPTVSKGAPAKKLGIAKQVVRAVIRDGVAETEVDQTFSNPGGEPIEGWYWFTVPTSATVTGFALETNGQLVEGEVIEKREAAARYEQAVRASTDPALLEWVDGRTYRARVFPIPASGTRRVVLRYIEMLPAVSGKTQYVYPLRSEDPVRFDEFALSVDIGASDQEVDVASSLDARVEPSGRIVSMRRSGYVPQADFQLELTAKKKSPPVGAWRFSAGADQADYVMFRYVPDADFAKLPASDADVVLVVDTSAGGDQQARQLRVAAAEASLRALSDKDHFALVTLDVASAVIYPPEGLAPATESDIAKALERLANRAMGGATDLGAMFEPALARLHGKDQAALVYIGDGAPTSGEISEEELLERLRRSLSGSRARFFALGTGADARHALLTQLTRAGGGQYVRIDEPGQTTGNALRLMSAIKTATITDVGIDIGAGLDQPLYSATGKLSRGEELVLLARTHHPLPKSVSVRGRLGGKDFNEKYELNVATDTITSSMVPRLWAAEYARRLMGEMTDENRSQILQLGVEYGLVTPYTSSLALENEAAYARMGIVRKHSRVRGVRLTSIERPSDEENLLRGLGIFATPPTMMGCDRRAPSEERSAPMPMERSGTENSAGAPIPPEQLSYAQDSDRLPAAQATAVTAKASSPPQAAGAAPNDPHLARGNMWGQGIGDAFGNGQGGGASFGMIGKSPSIRPGAVQVTGRLPQEVIQRVVRQNFGRFRTCYENGLRTNPNLQGRVAVKFVIDRSGGVSTAQEGGSDLPDQGVVSCVVRSFTNLSFPQPEGGIVTVVFPINFSPGEGDASAKPAAPKPAPTPVARMVRALGRCSDVASRPLAERIVLWQKRAKKTENASELAELYDKAYAACELPDWRDEAALLDILQRRIDTEQAAEIVLAHFADSSVHQQFIAKNLLRRTVDLRVAAVVSRLLYGGIDWTKIDREIDDTDRPEKQLALLKAAMLVAPGDPQGDVRLVKLLARSGERENALAYGRRLRDRGIVTPSLAQQLGDVLADAGERDEALRTYSEIVEFDGQNPLSRRVLGDVFLRQGWYAAAYRQYKTLTDIDGKDPLAWLRLANAAAGAGRVDEALRIDREVASREGTPGPNDPRMFARLLSAARLGILLDKPDSGVTREAVSRKLKELSLFSGPGVLALLTWDDLDAKLVIGALDEKKETLEGESTDAGVVGLYSVLGSAASWEHALRAARYRSEILARKVPYKLVVLTWDGKDFGVTTKSGALEPKAKQASL
ncbi:MAG: AgmX/PglI C-terminal domain-containing protein [Polyangiaceae bacterium]|nr:AgmX/PglI C-terminal domain-containing protein [Polyangiaceae bacterium]